MSAQAGDISERPPSRSTRAWAILIITALVGLVLDLWSKSLAFAHVAGFPVVVEREDVLSVPDLGMLIPPHDPRTVIPSVLEFTLVLNPGAVFGIGAGKRWFFVIFTVIACLVAVTLFLKWTRARDWVAHAGFGLIIAGGLGNLYDRLVFACVRDFIHPLPGVQLPFGLKWPGGSTEIWPYVSNVADAFLIFGILMLMYHAWRMPEPGVEDATEPLATTSTADTDD
ncbi:MAG: signal peptidase II [bacterium]|nr:signal peptidase II [bacterium]